MKSSIYLLLCVATLGLTACDKPAESSTEKPVLYLKDAPLEAREEFANSFKESCISEAMKQNGVTEAMRSKLQNYCDCMVKKSEEILTIEQIKKMAEGDKRTEKEFLGRLKPMIFSCMK